MYNCIIMLESVTFLPIKILFFSFFSYKEYEKKIIITFLIIKTKLKLYIIQNLNA